MALIVRRFYNYPSILSKNTYSIFQPTSKSISYYKLDSRFTFKRFEHSPNVVNYISSVKQDILNLKGKIPSLEIHHPASVKIEVIDNVGLINFESLNSKVNVMDSDMVLKLTDALEQLNSDPSVKIIIFASAKKKSFFAGADIMFLNQLDHQTSANASLCFQNFIKAVLISKPTVTLIEGNCLGAGLELALASTCSISINDSVSFGFPEFHIGLIPGGLGTLLASNRFPQHSLFSTVITGRTFSLKQARRSGIITHHISIPDYDSYRNYLSLFSNIVQNFLKVTKNHPRYRFHNHVKTLILEPSNSNNLSTSNGADKMTKVDIGLAWVNYFLYNFMKIIMYPNLWHNSLYYNSKRQDIIKLMDVINTPSLLTKREFDDYCQLESKIFSDSFIDPFSTNQKKLHVCKNYTQKDLPLNSDLSEIKKICVVGYLGHIGKQIAKMAAGHDSDKLLRIDKDEFEILESSLSGDNIFWDANSTEQSFIIHPNLINFTNDNSPDIIFEAATEDVELKREIFQFFDSMCKKNTIFATCTSAITLQELTSGIKNKENFIGTHFISPIEKINFVEIVKGSYTSPEVLSRVLSLMKDWKKTCIIVNDSPGFFTTRIIATMIMETFSLYEEGVPPNILDQELRLFGFRFNFSESIDWIGLDTCRKVLTYLLSSLKTFETKTPSQGLMNYLIQSGSLGVKNLEGINSYNFSGNVIFSSLPSYHFQKYIRSLPHYGLTYFYPEKVQPRIIMRILNECCRCLQEGVIDSPTTGDVAAVYGLGFPSALGGPFSFIDHSSPTEVVECLNNLYESTENSAYKPAKLLVDMANNNKRFYPV